MLRAFHLEHLDPLVPQMPGEPGPVAACAFYPGAPHGAKALRPAQEPLVTLRGRRHARLAQTPAEVVEGYRHVEVEVRVHTQDHRNLRDVRLLGTDRPHVRKLLSMSRSLRAGERERTDDTVRGHVTGELL